VYKAVNTLPNVHFFFIGETYLNKYYTDAQDASCMNVWGKILTKPNVHYWNAIPSDISQSVLSVFAVGIIPYDIKDSFTDNSHPIKFYNYLASKIPVISTPVPSLLQYTSAAPIEFARTSDEFVSLIKKRATMKQSFSPTVIHRIQNIVHRQSVDAKYHQLLKIFQRYSV